MIYKITWSSTWKCLLLLIPVVNIVVHIITCIKLAHAFGKGGWFAFGLVVFGFVFYAILGFDKSVYLGVPTDA